jgi:hypothetical protein
MTCPDLFGLALRTQGSVSAFSSPAQYATAQGVSRGGFLTDSHVESRFLLFSHTEVSEWILQQP